MPGYISIQTQISLLIWHQPHHWPLVPWCFYLMSGLVSGRDGILRRPLDSSPEHFLQGVGSAASPVDHQLEIQLPFEGGKEHHQNTWKIPSLPSVGTRASHSLSLQMCSVVIIHFPPTPRIPHLHCSALLMLSILISEGRREALKRDSL